MNHSFAALCRTRTGILAGLASIAIAMLAAGAPTTVLAAETAVAVRTPPADPAIVRGTLPNGLRYAVMSNNKPSNAVSVRFYIETGSLQETEAERGVAHYLEHMAFEGGRAIPGDELSTRFQEAGVSMERDRNAFTNLLGTYYVLDLQQATGPKLDLAFSWLRDVADGLALDPAAVERQRGVVTSEYYARRDGGTSVGEAIVRFIGPELLGPRRSPGGTPDTLKAISADMLKAFYAKWYRPERAFVIIVGDQPVDVLRARVEKTFGSWRANGPTPVEPDIGRLDYNRKTAFFEVNAPNFAQGVIEACRLAPADPHLPPSVASWRRAAEDAGWMLPLQQRLDHIGRDPASPFISARIERTEQQHRFATTCVVATPKADKWRQTLDAINDEMRRLDLYGVSDVEFDQAMGVMKARIESLTSGARTSPQIAQGLISVLLEDDVAVSPATLKSLFDEARKSVKPEDARSAYARAWRNASAPLVAMVSVAPASLVELQTAWDKSLSRPAPAKPAASEAETWAYADLGKPGEVVQRQTISDPSFVRITFANGVRANIKTLRSEKDRVEIRVRFGAGQLEMAPKDLVPAYLGSGQLISGGLGRHDEEQLERLLDLKAVAVRFTMNRDHFTLAGGSRKSDAVFLSQVLTAFLLDPGFRSESDVHIPSTVKSFYTTLRVEPIAAAQQALREALPGPSVFGLPPEDKAAALKAGDFARLLKPILTEDPIEVTIAGDISEQDATRIIAASFGAMPPRPGVMDRARADAVRIHYPTGGLKPLVVNHVGLRDKAAVMAVWPTFVWVPDRQREVRAVTLLREVLSERVRKVVRERLGQTYTPEVSYSTERGGDDGSLSVAIETNPAATVEVIKEIAAIGRSLASGDVTREELERVRKPLLDDTAHRRETVSWWLNTLDGSYADPYRLAQARTWQHDYSTIPVDEVNAAARKWLGRDPLIAVAVPEPTAIVASEMKSSAYH